MDKNILDLVKKVAEVVVAVIDICSEEQENSMGNIDFWKSLKRLGKIAVAVAEILGGKQIGQSIFTIILVKYTFEVLFGLFRYCFVLKCDLYGNNRNIGSNKMF